MSLRWFLSRTVRQATDLRKQVWKLLQHQRDLLPPPATAAVTDGLAQMKSQLRSGATPAALRDEMQALEQTATKWLRPYPHASFRENIEVFLVAIAVAMAIRTFFLQPF